VLRGQPNALGAGHGSVMLVTGPAGVGKTTLLDEAARLAADDGIRVFRAGKPGPGTKKYRGAGKGLLSGACC
jgi:serine kinase of HPr protein (carbohydrate metabolism regulator)